MRAPLDRRPSQSVCRPEARLEFAVPANEFAVPMKNSLFRSLKGFRPNPDFAGFRPQNMDQSVLVGK
jgi:hypothetical protein